jgi:hypothetical protein
MPSRQPSVTTPTRAQLEQALDKRLNEAQQLLTKCTDQLASIDGVEKLAVLLRKEIAYMTSVRSKTQHWWTD